jgi:hypothetical protein
MVARLGTGELTTNLDVEKRALRLLCAGTSQGAVRDGLISLLRSYQWQSTLHQAIFKAVVSIPSDDPDLLRQLLPAKLTRMGFPDVEWEELFAPLSMSGEEAVALARQMIGGV